MAEKAGGAFSELIRFKEAAPTTGETGGGETDGPIKVVLITEGPGNSDDRNYYSGEMLETYAPQFEGTKCFLDHASLSEEADRPERSVRDLSGWFRGVGVENVDGKRAIVANLELAGGSTAAREARELISSELRYQQQFPDRNDVLAGLSINAMGKYHPEIIDGEEWKIADSFDRVVSVDLVTFPARGGRFMPFREAEKVLAAYRQQRMQESNSATALGALLRPTAQQEAGTPNSRGVAGEESVEQSAGRLALLDDLRSKLSEGRATVHDPLVIAQLLDAFEAFLSEEIAELTKPVAGDAAAITEEAGMTSAGGNIGALSETTDGNSLPTAQAVQDPAAAAAASEAQAPAAEPAPNKACPTCGHQMTESFPAERVAGETENKPMVECATGSKEESMKESNQSATAPAAGTTQMIESDRVDLMRLRAKERQAEQLTKANAAIEAAGVFVDPEELITFQESQWPMLLRTMPRGVAPVGGTATMAARESVAGSRVPANASAIEVFDSVMGA